MGTIRLRIFNKEIYENLNNVAPDNFLGGAYASTGTITLAAQQKETAYYMTRQKKNSGKQNQP